MRDDVKQCVEIIRHCGNSKDGSACPECPFNLLDDEKDPCVNQLFRKSADLIESLAAELEQVKREREELAEKCRQLEARNDTLIAKEVLFDEAIAAGAKMQRERDAYFDSMKGICATCKKAKYCMLNPLPKCPNWQWRGVKED